MTESKVVEKKASRVLRTGISGFDSLFSEGGIPRGNSVLIAGGTGTGKSTLCRQTCFNLVASGKNCMYVSFEESIEKIVRSMEIFGWDVKKHIDEGRLLIQKINPLDILRMKFGSLGGSGSATEVSYKIKPLIIPKDFHPELIVVDSLTAVISASISKEKNYRVYLQQLFSFFEETNATSFLITETEQMPTRFSDTGIEEFLADGIIVLYSIRRKDRREHAVEVLKMRYTNHERRVVALDLSVDGIKVFPDKIVSLQ
ncbi:MAG: ATPase domain-containing protein [Candidatus Thermoplasmatota archaeon]